MARTERSIIWWLIDKGKKNYYILEKMKNITEEGKRVEYGTEQNAEGQEVM